MIIISEEAMEHLNNLMNQEGITSDSHHLRVGVKGGGCSGLSYVMDFDTIIELTDEIINLDKLKVVIDTNIWIRVLLKGQITLPDFSR